MKVLGHLGHLGQTGSTLLTTGKAATLQQAAPRLPLQRLALLLDQTRRGAQQRPGTVARDSHGRCSFFIIDLREADSRRGLLTTPATPILQSRFDLCITKL